MVVGKREGWAKGGGGRMDGRTDGRTDGLKTKEGRRKELRAINTKSTVASVRNDVNLEAKKKK